ncbi:uncharacterized protein WCC33_014425 [Rhinophrynus dorsalis]
MNKHKKNMIERFLNHTLEIIYLLTGEEYIMVKKNTPHSSMHLLTGEVPITCGDVSVYFSMEEWEYIEGHKEIYEDVMKENQQNLNTKEIPGDKSAGLRDETLDVLSCDHQGEYVRVEENIQKREVLSDSCPSQDSTEMNAGAEELCVRKQQETPSEDIYEVSSTEDKPRALNITERPQTVGCLSYIILEDESPPTADEFEGTAEGETHALQRYQEGSPRNSSYEPSSYETVNLTSTSLSSQHEHDLCPINVHLVEGGNGAEYNSVQTYEEESLMCSEQYDGESAANDDRTADPDGKQYECTDCGKRYLYKCNFVWHQRKHQEGKSRNQCAECGKQFAFQSSLIKHRKTHTGEKSHKCNVCGKPFALKYNLVQHLRIHTGEKPYQCAECGKYFAYKSAYNQHQKVHLKEKANVCPVCGKCFTRRANLIAHQRIHIKECPYVLN